MLGIEEKYSKKGKNNKETGNHQSCLRIFIPNQKFNFFHNLIFSFQIVLASGFQGSRSSGVQKVLENE